MTKGKVGKGVGCMSVLVISKPSLRYERLRICEMLGVLHCRRSTSNKVSSLGNLKNEKYIICGQLSISQFEPDIHR